MCSNFIIILFQIISSVQTCGLYCHFCSILVRLTVTTDLFSLLSLLLLLELLSLVCWPRRLTQQSAFNFDLVVLPLAYSLQFPICCSLSDYHLFWLCWLPPFTISFPSSLSPYGCCTLREPVTGALTPCAFNRSCAHMSSALTLSQDKPTPWSSFKPHPLTAA